MVYTAFTVETLLVFVYKLLTNSVAQPAAAAAPRYVPVADTFCTLWYPQTQTRSPAAVPGSRPPDCRLLPPNPSRNKPRTAAAAAQGSVPAHSITMGFALHVSSSHYDHIVLWSLTT